METSSEKNLRDQLKVLNVYKVLEIVCNSAAALNSFQTYIFLQIATVLSWICFDFLKFILSSNRLLFLLRLFTKFCQNKRCFDGLVHLLLFIRQQQILLRMQTELFCMLNGYYYKYSNHKLECVNEPNIITVFYF